MSELLKTWDLEQNSGYIGGATMVQTPEDARYYHGDWIAWEAMVAVACEVQDQANYAAAKKAAMEKILVGVNAERLEALRLALEKITRLEAELEYYIGE